MADTCPGCGMDDHECIGDSHSRCPDAWHDEPTNPCDTCPTMLCSKCPDEPATPPAAPTVAARREAVMESLGNATAFCSRYAQARAAEVTAELTRLWAIEDAANGYLDSTGTPIAIRRRALRAALKGAEHE